ncbi:MAG: 50S ribosomal protein L3 [Planctomycetes bacterium]|nr:50S ribosomal protein L3 [Planctomycetota bacterium]
MPRRVRKTILGRKLGMTQLFDAKNEIVPVTLIEAGPCTVLQVKTAERDGYEALQVGYADKSFKSVKKPQEAIFKKAQTAAKRVVREIPRFLAKEVKAGDHITIADLEGVKSVDVSGVSRGRGFSGVVRRWNKRIGPKSHGSKSKRVIGSQGMHQDPGRVIKGKKMPGQYGAERVKVRNLEVMSIDPQQNLLVVRGAVPGPRGGFLCIEESLQ